MWYQNIWSVSLNFVTIHASDRQTSGRTDRITTPKTAPAYARMGKTDEHNKPGKRLKSIITAQWVRRRKLNQPGHCSNSNPNSTSIYGCRCKTPQCPHISSHYNPLISCPDLSLILVRLAAKSYITSWCIHTLSERALKR